MPLNGHPLSEQCLANDEALTRCYVVSAMPHPLLAEYLAARDKIDDAARAIAERRQADLACKPGCHSCCVGGLSILSVEAFALQEHVDAHGLSSPPSPPPGGCAFLDRGGACTVYEARPFVCRTHGLPLRMPRETSGERPAQRRTLRVLDDTEVCELNFTKRTPAAEDVLDAERISALLLVVEQRFRAAAGLEGAYQRISLEGLLEQG